MVHSLKTWPEFYNEIVSGRKHFEVRLHDRDYNAGDKLCLREWDPKTSEYTGRVTERYVTYIMFGGQFGIEPGYCVMSLDPEICKMV